MTKFGFWHGERESILWTFDRDPDIGELIVLGDAGVFRITGMRPHTLASIADKEYTCERVRDATREDLKAMFQRGVNRLPSRGEGPGKLTTGDVLGG